MIKPLYYYESDTYIDKAGGIIFHDDDYKTKELIGINSTIEEFIKKYPDYPLWWSYINDMYVLDSETVGYNIQFVFDADDCNIDPDTDSDMTLLNRTNFKEGSQIKKTEYGHWNEISFNKSEFNFQLSILNF